MKGVEKVAFVRFNASCQAVAAHELAHPFVADIVGSDVSERKRSFVSLSKLSAEGASIKHEFVAIRTTENSRCG